MSKKFKIKKFDEKKYKAILKEVDLGHYQLFLQGEKLPGDLFSKINHISNYSHVIAGTGVTNHQFAITSVNFSEIVIPKASQVSVVRFLRYDNSHGEPHYNVDDTIIFPDIKGDIYSFHRKDAPDHFIAISGDSHIISIADAYKLSSEKAGTIEQYKEKGASLHIEVEPLND